MEYEVVAGWKGTVLITSNRQRAIEAYNYAADHTDNGVVLFRNGEVFMEQLPVYDNGEE